MEYKKPYMERGGNDMLYKLMVVVERDDGYVFRQCVARLTPEESSNEELVHAKIQDYKKILGKGYFIIDRYFE